MSFPAFVLFFCVVLWLSFGPKWLFSKISAQKDKSSFYKAVYTFRYALLVIVSNLGVELVIILYEFL